VATRSVSMAKRHGARASRIARRARHGTKTAARSRGHRACRRGETMVNRVFTYDRGFERMEEKVKSLRRASSGSVTRGCPGSQNDRGGRPDT